MKIKDNIPGNYQYWALHEASPLRRSWHNNKLRLIELMMLPNSSDFVVDAGCGSGNVSAFLADFCQSCLGIDIDPNAVQFASKTYSGKNNLRFIESKFSDVPITNNTVDKIYCIEVIEHLDSSDIISMLDIFNNWLKVDGQLLITTPNYRSLWPIIEWFSDTFALSPQMANEQHITRFSPKSFAEILTMNRFSVNKLGSFNFMSPFIAFLSWKTSLKLNNWEIMSISTIGNILYALCTKRV